MSPGVGVWLSVLPVALSARGVACAGEVTGEGGEEDAREDGREYEREDGREDSVGAAGGDLVI